MKDDRFAGLGAAALNEAERESVVRLALEVMANGVTGGPIMTSEADAVRYLQLKTGGERRCVMEAVLVCENDGAEYAAHAAEPRRQGRIPVRRGGCVRGGLAVGRRRHGLGARAGGPSCDVDAAETPPMLH